MKNRDYKQSEFNCKLIQIVRKQKGYTLQKLAEASDVPFQRISEIESGHMISKNEKYIPKIEKALNISLSEDSKEDLEILERFDEFCHVLFYGNLNTEKMQKEVNQFYEKSLDSKYYYLVYVMKYVFDVLSQNKPSFDDRVLKGIDFDTKAFHIYQIYKGVYFYRNGSLNESRNVLESVIHHSDNEKIRCLAQFYLIYVLLDQFKLQEAASLTEKTKEFFLENCSYIRAHKCNILLANVNACQHQYKYSIPLYKQCIEAAYSLNFPESEVLFLYRNIALDYILSGNYEQAIKYLDQAYAKENNHERSILYYLIVYYYINDIEKYEYWLKKAEKANDHIYDTSLKAELDFWSIIGKTKFEPSKKAMKAAEEVYRYYEKLKNYESMFFYLEIILMLCKQLNDEKKEIIYLKKEKELMFFVRNS